MWDWAEDQVILSFIRHGETPANEKGRYLGRTDESLSEHGRQVLWSYKEQNLYPEADYLFTSPMKRCMETAKILYPMQNPIIIPEWKEMDFGRFEYKNYEELKTDPYYQKWIDSGGTMAFPGGESRASFVRRCGQGLQRMCVLLRRAQTENTKGIIRVSVIVHGGTIMALLSSCGKSESPKGYFDYQTKNGRGYLCSMDGWNKTPVSLDEKETKSESEIWIKELAKI